MIKHNSLLSFVSFYQTEFTCSNSPSQTNDKSAQTVKLDTWDSRTRNVSFSCTQMLVGSNASAWQDRHCPNAHMASLPRGRLDIFHRTGSWEQFLPDTFPALQTSPDRSFRWERIALTMAHGYTNCAGFQFGSGWAVRSPPWSTARYPA